MININREALFGQAPQKCYVVTVNALLKTVFATPPSLAIRGPFFQKCGHVKKVEKPKNPGKSLEPFPGRPAHFGSLKTCALQKNGKYEPIKKNRMSLSLPVLAQF